MDTYDSYNLFNFGIPLGSSGDSYDRYFLRLEEMRESLFIMSQCINKLYYFNNIDNFQYQVNDNKLAFPPREKLFYDMESLIHHFKLYSEGFLVPKEEIYNVVESPKGEFGLYILSDNTNRPSRCRIKAPGFLHLQMLDYISRDTFLADIVAIIGTMDIVFGEIDR